MQGKLEVMRSVQQALGSYFTHLEVWALRQKITQIWVSCFEDPLQTIVRIAVKCHTLAVLRIGKPSGKKFIIFLIWECFHMKQQRNY